MGTNYPGSLDAYSRPSASTPMNASGYEGHTVVDNLYDAVEAIETELGTDPAGAQATVRARLDGYQRFHSSTLWPKANTRWFEAGLVVSSNGSVGNATANRLYYGAVWVPSTVTLAAVGVSVQTSATGNVRMGIYTSTAGSGGLVPSSLLVDAGTASTSTTGDKTIATTQVLTGQAWYFLAAVFDAAPTMYGFLRGAFGAAIDLGAGIDYLTEGWYQSHTYGALPSSPGTLTPRDNATAGCGNDVFMWMNL